jgi:hypothetical protein
MRRPQVELIGHELGQALHPRHGLDGPADLEALAVVSLEQVNGSR